jgi:hypothetical protein
MPPTIQQRVAELRALDPTAKAANDKLRSALGGTTGMVVAAAASIVEDHRLAALVDELPAAFARLCEDPIKRDPGCRGKIAIAKALHGLDRWEDRVFVFGLHYEQLEGWGQSRDDTAAELRGLCGLAHAHFGRSDALDVLVELLLDRERTARLAAAQAIGDAGRPDATALLRFKLLTGDAEPAVLSACVESLFSLARDASYAFVVHLLRDHDERAEVAALGLGGARFAEALEALTGWCTGAHPEQRHRVGYLAIALLRSDAGNDYLLDAIRSHGRADAIAAGRALATFKDDAAIADAAQAAAAEHKDKAVRIEIAQLFDRPRPK